MRQSGLIAFAARDLMFAGQSEIPDAMAVPLTPCINVCVLDTLSGLCRGCGRTADEIARWSSLDDSERARIMALLPGRLPVPGTAPTGV